MLRRISNLQPDTRTLVRIASLGESHLQHDRLAEVCGLDEQRLEAALDEAVSTMSSRLTSTAPDTASITA